MSARVCTTVFGYAGGTEIARRHLPLWRAHSDEVILVFPADSPSILEDVLMLAHGRSNKYGSECLRRQLFGMRQALKARADYYVFVEYDAFLLDRPRERPGLQGNAFHNGSPEFHAEWFFHFPWIMDAESLDRFARSATFEPFEKGFADRWVAAQVAQLGIPTFDLQVHAEGYSRNTIQAPDQIDAAVRLARRGAYAFHGIKSARVLDQLAGAYAGAREP